MTTDDKRDIEDVTVTMTLLWWIHYSITSIMCDESNSELQTPTAWLADEWEQGQNVGFSIFVSLIVRCINNLHFFLFSLSFFIFLHPQKTEKMHKVRTAERNFDSWTAVGDCNFYMGTDRCMVSVSWRPNCQRTFCLPMMMTSLSVKLKIPHKCTHKRTQNKTMWTWMHE